MGKILLFYKYTAFESPKKICKWQMKLCKELQLTGRIIIAHEGINGTLGGTEENTERYKRIMQEHPQLHDIAFKESPGGSNCFSNLKVTIKNEIVKLGINNGAHINNGGIHLTPKETHQLLTQKPNDLIILDTRNNFESAIGAFEGAIKPNIKHFRDFPHYIDNTLEQFKDKQVLMYCTGGVRCERATAYLKEKNVAKEIYQIDGGIHTYAEQYPDGYFRGKNYVFDNRIALKITDDILGSCALCNEPSDDYNNCLNAICNKHYIGCTKCVDTYNQCCSLDCQKLIATEKVKTRPPFQKISPDLSL